MLSDRTILGMRTHSRIPPGTLCVSKPQTINSANLAYEEGPATEGNNSAKGENMARGLFVCLFVCLSFWGEGVREREREKQKIRVLRSNLKESREGLCLRGKGRPLSVEGPKTEKSREPTVESLV